MARRLRIQYPGARYHVINRGNLQHDVFATRGAVRSFTKTMGQAAEQYGWRVHAYVIMRNHYHLALETPRPNLVEGMHWLQSTFAVRLTRFHRQHGHVFQGRYQSLLVEDSFHLRRVCDYIHLNPARAGVVPIADIGLYKASSLWCWLQGKAAAWLCGAEILQEAGLDAAANPWQQYKRHLMTLAESRTVDERMTRGAYSKGWAIGTSGWRRTLARDHQHLALAPELLSSEIADLKRVCWHDALAKALASCGKTPSHLRGAPKGAPWKVSLARSLRATVAAPYAWIAAELHMGSAASVRVYVARKDLTTSGLTP